MEFLDQQPLVPISTDAFAALPLRLRGLRSLTPAHGTALWVADSGGGQSICVAFEWCEQRGALMLANPAGAATNALLKAGDQWLDDGQTRCCVIRKLHTLDWPCAVRAGRLGLRAVQ